MRKRDGIKQSQCGQIGSNSNRTARRHWSQSRELWLSTEWKANSLKIKVAHSGNPRGERYDVREKQGGNWSSDSNCLLSLRGEKIEVFLFFNKRSRYVKLSQQS